MSSQASIEKLTIEIENGDFRVSTATIVYITNNHKIYCAKH